MTNIWEPNKKYFVKLPEVVLQTVIPDMIKQKFGYDLNNDWKLADVCRMIKYCADGDVAISNQIVPYGIKSQGSTSVRDFISEEDFNLALMAFGIPAFLTEQEYRELETLTNIN